MRYINKTKQIYENEEFFKDFIDTLAYNINLETNLDIEVNYSDSRFDCNIYLMKNGLFGRKKDRDICGIHYDISFSDEIVVYCNTKTIKQIVENTIKEIGEDKFDTYIYWGEL